MRVEELFTEEGMTTISDLPNKPFVRPKKKKKKGDQVKEKS